MNNKRQGKGEYTWPDGRKYTGEFENDMKCGFGVLEFADGRKYVGEWKNDKQHGKGHFHMTSGHSKEGLWENGRRVSDVQTGETATTPSSRQKSKILTTHED